MRNLIELSKEVQTLMQQIIDIDANRDRLQALNTRAKMIHDIRQKFDEAKAARATLIEGRVTVSSMPKASKQLINKSRQVIAGFEKDWEKTVREASLSKIFIELAKDHTERKVLQELKKDWRTYVDSEAPPIKQDWLDRLPDSAFGEAKRSISKLLDEIQDLRADLPDNVASVSRVKESAKEAGDIFADLDNIPPMIRGFLGKAARGEARIDELTEEVGKWLSEHDMLDQLRIRFR